MGVGDDILNPDRFPQPTPRDYASHLAALRTPLSRQGVEERALQDNYPLLYRLAVLGITNQPDLALFDSEMRKRDEICHHYLPILIRDPTEDFTWISSSHFVNDYPSLSIRAAIIMHLQRHMVCLSIPFAEGRWLGFHRIRPLSTDLPNMNVSNTLNSLEGKRTFYHRVLHRLFHTTPAPALTLSRVRWIDFGLTLMYCVLPGRTKLQMLKAWAGVVPAARKSVGLFCATIQIDSLDAGSVKVNTPQIPIAQEMTFRATEGSEVLPSSYQDWECREVFEYFYRTLFRCTVPLDDNFDQFMRTYSDLCIDHISQQALAVVFIAHLDQCYRGPAASYQKWQEIFCQLLQRLHQMLGGANYVFDENNLIPSGSHLEDAYKDIHRFLLAGLVVRHLSTLYPLCLCDMTHWFAVIYNLASPLKLIQTLLQPMVPWMDQPTYREFDMRGVNAHYASTPEEGLLLFVKYLHYRLRLRNGFLPQDPPKGRNRRTMDFGELIDLWDKIRSTGVDFSKTLAFHHLYLQYLTREVLVLMDKVLALPRDLCTMSVDSLKEMHVPSIGQLSLAIRQLSYTQTRYCPKSWEVDSKNYAFQLAPTMYSTLPFWGLAQEECTRFLAGMLGGGSNGKRVNLRVVQRLGLGNALRLDGQWNADEESLTISIHYFHRITLHTYCERVILNIRRREIGKEEKLCNLLGGIIELLCDERIDESVIITQSVKSGEIDNYYRDLLQCLDRITSEREISEQLADSYSFLRMHYNTLLSRLFSSGYQFQDGLNQILFEIIRVPVAPAGTPLKENKRFLALIALLKEYCDQAFVNREGFSYLQSLIEHGISIFVNPYYRLGIALREYHRTMPGPVESQDRLLRSLFVSVWRVKYAMRRIVCAMGEVAVTRIAPEERCRVAASGRLWPSTTGDLSLIPLECAGPPHECYGILRASYGELVALLAERILRGDIFLQDKLCKLNVYDRGGRVLEFWVGLSVDQGGDYYRIVLCLPPFQDILFAANYQKDTSGDELRNMLLWQLAQLKVEYYRQMT